MTTTNKLRSSRVNGDGRNFEEASHVLPNMKPVFQVGVHYIFDVPTSKIDLIEMLEKSGTGDPPRCIRFQMDVWKTVHTSDRSQHQKKSKN